MEILEQHGDLDFTEHEVRLGAKIAVACVAPFLIIALAKLALNIILNPLVFISLWAMGLAIGFFATATIEFDDYMRPLAAVMEPEPEPEPEPLAEEEPDFLDASNLTAPTEAVPGLGGQGESQLDPVNPESIIPTPVEGPRIQSRSRPLTMRFQKCNGTRILSSDLLPSIPETEETNALTSSDSSSILADNTSIAK